MQIGDTFKWAKSEWRITIIDDEGLVAVAVDCATVKFYTKRGGETWQLLESSVLSADSHQPTNS